MTSIWYARCSSVESSGSGHPEKDSDIGLLHNLMNTLTAQVVRICNFSKSKAITAHLNNFRISINIRRWSRLQWAPCPSSQLLQCFDFVRRKLILLIALPHVTHPSPEVNFSAVHDFHMNRGYTSMPSAFGELRQCFDIKFESSVVIHMRTL